MRTKTGKQNECLTYFTRSQFMSILESAQEGDVLHIHSEHIAEFGRITAALLNDDTIIVFTAIPESEPLPF